ncbi:MAG: hypothetical protein E7100_06700 [Bacteroidaceae bacterium]|nr:hypothetical protein [Bacteroidaceae bacterium]
MKKFLGHFLGQRYLCLCPNMVSSLDIPCYKVMYGAHFLLYCSSLVYGEIGYFLNKPQNRMQE